MQNDNNLSKILNELSSRGFNAEKLSSAAQKGDINAILKLMSEDDRKKLTAALNNPQLIKNMRDKYNG